MATVAIAGATGGVGRHVIRHALADGHTVRALIPEHERLADRPGLTLIYGDVGAPDDVDELLEGADIVLSCLEGRKRDGITVQAGVSALLDGMDDHNIQRLVWVSAIGVGNSRAQLVRMSKVFAWFIQPLLLRGTYADLTAAESIVRLRRTRTAVTVRPAGLNNKPAARNWRQGDHDTDVGPSISRSDVAAFMVQCIDATRFDGRAISIGGA